jgi:hypothetical protein
MGETTTPHCMRNITNTAVIQSLVPLAFTYYSKIIAVYRRFKNFFRAVFKL